ncbi:hypothetical protein NDU88_004040 [Pleurodeles waltl]|uniref:Uncharacterized protein n=1 Tax=Pleurodeles waltl TaxID=8319 RepID=A0AAV7WQS1_PLEWA|nr:hypothetical protein NDU88_004040 [Pleurodeles waltl]
MVSDHHGHWTYDTPVTAKSGSISGGSDARPTGSLDSYEVHSLGAGGVVVLWCQLTESSDSLSARSTASGKAVSFAKSHGVVRCR